MRLLCRISSRLVGATLLLDVLALPGRAADADRLLFHAETVSGTVLTSQRPDEPFNPASVVKVGTSLWTLDILGPEYRYRTEFGFNGRRDPEAGRIEGDLVVIGGGDPDFHYENAFLVARALNRIGVRHVTGDILVERLFWIGWGNGIEGRFDDPEVRAGVMGERLRQALDSRVWDARILTAWQELCDRRGWDQRSRPQVTVAGRAVYSTADAQRVLLAHLSNPLAVLLKRFNTYSNNDLIRVAEPLGGAPALQAYLRQRLGVEGGEIELATTSGQGTNRMTARVVVEMMRQFLATARKRHVRVGDLLPIPGCDPGPTRRMFPRLASGELANSMVCKTGTLTTTDGGVVVLAGYLQSHRHGIVLFCIAAPQTGRSITRWRRIEQEWLLDMIDKVGRIEQYPCGADLPFSDSHALVESVDPAASERPSIDDQVGEQDPVVW